MQYKIRFRTPACDALVNAVYHLEAEAGLGAAFDEELRKTLDQMQQFPESNGSWRRVSSSMTWVITASAVSETN